MPALLCLLLHAAPPAVDATPPVAAAGAQDELAVEQNPPLGIVSGPAVAVAALAPVLAVLALLGAGCPLCVAGCMLGCCGARRQDVYAGTAWVLGGISLAGLMACGPLLGSAAVVLDGLGFMAGQEATRLRLGSAMEKASTPAKAGRGVWRRVLRAVGTRNGLSNKTRLRDGVVAVALAAPALVGLGAAQLLAPLGCLAAFPYLFGVPNPTVPLVVLPPLLVLGSGVWWLFSATLLRPLLLLALEAPR